YDALGVWATGLGGMIGVTSVAYLPWVLGPQLEAISRIDGALEEAARASGARPLRAFADVAWPLVRREWWASIALVFSLTAATFGVPSFLGSWAARPYATLPTDMVERLHVGGPSAWTEALVSGFALVALSLVASVLGRSSASPGDAGRPAPPLQ